MTLPKTKPESDTHNHDPYTTDESDLFTVGQCYEDIAATTVICASCGGDEFHVGQGSYFTAIMCTKCRWEVCIHEG